MIAALLLWVGLAQAAPPIAGAWRVIQVDTEQGTLRFPEAMNEEGSRLVYGRWVWIFEDGRVLVRSEALRAFDEATRARGKAEERSARLSWCASSVAVDAGWQGDTLLLPGLVQTESRAQRFGKKDALITTTACSVRLNAVGPLRLTHAPADAPAGAMRLQTPTGTLAFTLVRDSATVNVKALLAE
jgi:hypothetical protein